jgi:lysophospholipase L1-like esterase
MTVRRLALSAAVVVACGSSSVAFQPPRAQASATPLQITVLGDSYSSGEGDPPFYPGTDVWKLGCSRADGCNMCHRSTQAWGAVVAHAIDGESLAVGQGSATFHLLACSGALISDMFGQDPMYAGEPAQISRLEALPAQDIIALTLGGNDVDFAGLITSCALVVSCEEKYDPYDGDTLLQQIALLEPRLAEALESIAAAAHAKSSGARVILVGYPRLFPADAAACTQLHAVFDSGEIRWFARIADAFQTMEAQAAAAAGVEEVDERDAFRGHELCVGASHLLGTPVRPGPALAVVPINPVDAVTPWLQQLEMHPSPLGQELLAQRVTAQITSKPPAGTHTIVLDEPLPGQSEGFRLQPIDEEGHPFGSTRFAAGSASVSPDGTRYASIATEGGPSATVYTVGGEQLTEAMPLRDVTGVVFAWAPGGHDYIAATPDGCLTWDAGTGASRRVVCANKSTGQPISATFTPDGRGVVWVGDMGPTNGFPVQPDALIYTDVASGRSRLLQSTVDAHIDDVVVSPDGGQVAYSETPSPDQPNPPSDVYTVAIASGTPRLLDPAARGGTQKPLWVGPSIVYSRATDQDRLGEPTAQVFVATPGGRPRQLTDLPTDIRHLTAEPVAALPEGDSIIITQIGEDTCTSYLLDTVTRRTQPLIATSDGNDSSVIGVSADGSYALVLGGDSCGGGAEEPSGFPIIWAPLHGPAAQIIGHAYGASLANSLPVADVP